MADFEIFGPYVVALLMGMGATCVLIWAVLAGALTDTDEAALNFFRAEMENDRRADDLADDREERHG
jgi:hypothetical protein